MFFRVVIPTRYASTRLPGKALLPLAGKPMIQWVYERAIASTAGEVVIATDDERIETAARAFCPTVVRTAATHESGTDRIAEVARARHWEKDDIVVNLQGDEPLMPPALIDQVAALLADHPQAGVATLAHPICSAEDFLNPNIVKVVADSAGRALYFSRAPIPWNRDDPSQRNCTGARRHIGLYAYRVGALARMGSLSPSLLETREKLEQLRALSNEIEIRVADADELPGPDVNSAADLERVSRLLE